MKARINFLETNWLQDHKQFTILFQYLFHSRFYFLCLRNQNLQTTVRLSLYWFSLSSMEKREPIAGPVVLIILIGILRLRHFRNYIPNQQNMNRVLNAELLYEWLNV